MATKKISEFTTLGSLSDSDILPVVNAGSNKKITGATLKQVVADSTDFADFKSRISGMQ